MPKMTACKTCGKEIASNAKTCPSCGAKNKKPFYKRWWFILIAIIVVLGAIGSSGGNKTSKDDKTSASDTNDSKAVENKETKKEEIKDIYSIGEEVKLNDNVLIVNKAEKSNGTDFDKPQDGKEFVIVNVTIKNGGKDEITYNPYDFEMANSQGQITDQAFTTVNTDTALQSGKLSTGGTVTGTIAFEQPTGDTGLVLKYKANMFSNNEVKIKIN